MIKYLISTLLLLVMAANALACNTQYNITLQTFGEGVLVELRSGTPGYSKVVQSRRSNGGVVNFGNLCPGNYFLADAVYTGSIVMQRGSGNVSHKSRKSL